MKTLPFKILSLAAFLALSASCSKEDSGDVDAAVGSELVANHKNEVHISTTFTKQSLSLSKKSDDGDAYVPQNFASGDYLVIAGEGIRGVLSLKPGGENSLTAVFEGTLTFDDGVSLTDATSLTATLKNDNFGNQGKTLSDGEIKEAATLEEAMQMYSCLTATFQYGDLNPVMLTENTAFVEIKGRVGDNSVTVNSKTYGLVDGAVYLAVPDNTELECDLIPGGSMTVRSLSKSTSIDASNEISGIFSVSAVKKVRFGKSNLQYDTRNRKFVFADHQYDYIGGTRNNKTDLFGWGTGNNPTENSTSNAKYANFNDWGAKVGTGWRTLSQTEWDYLLSDRPEAEAKHYFGFIAFLSRDKKDTLSYKFGMIILPDEWIITESFLTTLEDNTYTEDEWKDMEQSGAVFIPATSEQQFSETNKIMDGSYWTSSFINTSTFALRMQISHSYRAWNDSHVYGYGFSEYTRSNKFSVRLVKDI